MTIVFFLLALITVAGTAAAMALRNLVHCVLALSVGLVGLAVLYLELGAQFVGFTQILVYVGAVVILAVFAIMMTRNAEGPERSVLSASWMGGLVVAGLVFAVLAWAICSGTGGAKLLPTHPETSVGLIGVALMHQFVLPLEIIGLLLTAALIGAGVLAIDETGEKR